MYQLITTKGRKSADTLEALAAWIEEMQPSSTRIAWGEIETEVECSDDADAIVDELRRALRIEEADRLGFTVSNDNIYLGDLDAPHGALKFIRFDVGAPVLVSGYDHRPLADGETLESLL